MPVETSAKKHTPSHLFTALKHNTQNRPFKEIQTIQGQVPPKLNGVLYRNGPGIFTRGKHHKGTLLDGDGVVQRLELKNGRVFYSRQFVETKKLQAENQAQAFLNPSWTSKAPKALANIGGRVPSQAGVTAYVVHNTLLALDEVAPAYQLNPKTLQTLGPANLGLPKNDQFIKAHSRYLPTSDAWVFLSTRMGRKGLQISLVRHYANGQQKLTPTVQAPRMVYLHDFAATERYAILILQPAFLRLMPFLSGATTFSESLQWQPEQGNRILVIDFDTGACQQFEAPAAWVWHFTNAYHNKNELIVDFVGYDNPDHFLGPKAQLAAIMRDEIGTIGAPPTLRRYHINLANSQLKESQVAEGCHEFPSINLQQSTKAYDTVYTTFAPQHKGILHSQIAATQIENGHVKSYNFGPHVNVLEPIYAQCTNKQGWLISQILDTQKNTSAYAVFKANRVNDGPVALIDLNETVPISFHGYWLPQQA